jgi:hypothetical protein
MLACLLWQLCARTWIAGCGWAGVVSTSMWQTWCLLVCCAVQADVSRQDQQHLPPEKRLAAFMNRYAFERSAFATASYSSQAGHVTIGTMPPPAWWCTWAKLIVHSGGQLDLGLMMRLANGSTLCVVGNGLGVAT